MTLMSCIVNHYGIFFFFKQKTAYEMLRSLVGSEMCIRDRVRTPAGSARIPARRSATAPKRTRLNCPMGPRSRTCLLYTSDAADDLLCVDLGGRRIIKKKNVRYVTPTDINDKLKDMSVHTI